MKKTSESRTLVPWLRGRPWQTNRWITTGSQGSSEKQRNLYVYRRRRWNFTDTLSTYVFRCKASLTLARILFPRCFAMWRAKLCHLSRISYELFTKCVTPSVTRVHFTMESWQVVTPWKKCSTFKIFATTWHALLYLTRIATHPHAHCHWFFSHWHAKLACHGVNRLSFQCEACFTLLGVVEYQRRYLRMSGLCWCLLRRYVRTCIVLVGAEIYNHIYLAAVSDQTS